mgnify:CR=1 FL=1
MTGDDPETTLRTRLVGGLIRRVGLVTRAVTFGVVSVQMLTVTVPVEVQPATPGAVSV